MGGKLLLGIILAFLTNITFVGYEKEYIKFLILTCHILEIAMW